MYNIKHEKCISICISQLINYNNKTNCSALKLWLRVFDEWCTENGIIKILYSICTHQFCGIYRYAYYTRNVMKKIYLSKHK